MSAPQLSALTRMARSKTAHELYRLMSEVVSLRERMAQAELAAEESRRPSSEAKAGSDDLRNKPTKRHRREPTSPHR
jgi:hypothetical protein